MPPHQGFYRGGTEAVKIGMAGPIDITLLRDLFPPDVTIEKTFSFALTANLARAYYDRGHEVVLFAQSSEVKTTRLIEGDRISAYICPLRRPRYRMLDFFRQERRTLRDAMRASKCDVVHAHWTYDFASAAIASGVPHVVTAHDVVTAILRYEHHPHQVEKMLLAWPVLRNARCVTAPSPYVAEALKGFLRRTRNIVVVPNGVPQKQFDHFKQRQQHSDSGPMTFASVLQGWSKRKNAEKLIEAFAMLRAEFGDRVKLLMLGVDYENEGTACNWSRERHLGEGITFAGVQPFQTLMNRLLQEVDILVHPALEESFCMAAAEAMAVGIPVIGGLESGALSWVLGEGKAGLLVDVKSADSIAKGMRLMFEDSQMRKALALAGHERAFAEFRLEDVAAKYEAVLEKALEEQTR